MDNFIHQIKCDKCNNLTDIYLAEYWIKQIYLVTKKIKCRSCGHYIIMNDMKRKEALKTKKMKIERGEEGGNFLRNTDIGDGDIGDKETIEIMEEGEIKNGQYGERLQLPVNVNEEDKLFSVSNKNRNVIIDMYGDETEDWIGKEITLLVESCDVGKTGTQLTVIPPKKKKK